MCCCVRSKTDPSFSPLLPQGAFSLGVLAVKQIDGTLRKPTGGFDLRFDALGRLALESVREGNLGVLVTQEQDLPSVVRRGGVDLQVFEQEGGVFNFL